MAKLATEGAVNTRAQIDSELVWVQRALALLAGGRNSNMEPLGRCWPQRGRFVRKQKKRMAIWQMKNLPSL